jgi:hypothetical protein
MVAVIVVTPDASGSADRRSRASARRHADSSAASSTWPDLYDVPISGYEVGYQDQNGNWLPGVMERKAERLRVREMREKGLLRD